MDRIPMKFNTLTIIYLRYIYICVIFLKGVEMTKEERTRMMHIRLLEPIHKELRKIAAERDQTMQDVVASVVEQRIKKEDILARVQELERLAEEKALEMETRTLEIEMRSLELEKRGLELEEKAIEYEMTLELSEADPVSEHESPAMKSLRKIEKLALGLSEQIKVLKESILMEYEDADNED